MGVVCLCCCEKFLPGHWRWSCIVREISILKKKIQRKTIYFYQYFTFTIVLCPSFHDYFFVSLFIEISHPPLLFFHTASVLVLSLTVKDVIASVLGRNLDQDNSAEDIVQSNNFHYPISAQSLVCCYSLNEFFFF